MPKRPNQLLCQASTTFQLPCMPCKRLFTGFFFYLGVLVPTPTSNAPRTHNTTKQPNRQPWPLPMTSLLASLTWKLLKSASMSRQHRRMALSASNDVAGTWKCFPAAFSSAMRSFITPLRCHDLTFTPEALYVPKHMGGFWPPMCILSFKPPQPQRKVWDE